MGWKKRGFPDPSRKSRAPSLVLRRQCEAQFRFYAQFAIDKPFPFRKIERRTGFYNFAVHFQGIARAHHAFEFGVINAGLQGVFAFDFVLHQGTAGLRHDFAEHYARNNRIPGKVPL